MRLHGFVCAIALTASAQAFSDSTSWILLSTSSIENQGSRQMQTSADVLQRTKGFLSRCPTDNYLIVSQPGIRASDLRRYDDLAVPSLYRKAALDDRLVGKYIVSEVIGEIREPDIAEFVKSACASRQKQVTVEEVSLASVSPHDRLHTLSMSNEELYEPLARAGTRDSVTILAYFPPGEPIYESQFDMPLKIDLKRDLNSRRDTNQTTRDRRSLFEKYQFFTPGIFMGLLTVIILFTILGVGVRALTSLEVSYGAFEKEMGPAAHKKQQ